VAKPAEVKNSRLPAANARELNRSPEPHLRQHATRRFLFFGIFEKPPENLNMEIRETIVVLTGWMLTRDCSACFQLSIQPRLSESTFQSALISPVSPGCSYSHSFESGDFAPPSTRISSALS